MKLPKSFPPASIIALFIIAALIYLFAGCEQVTKPVDPINISGLWIGKTNQLIAGYPAEARIELVLIQHQNIISGNGTYLCKWYLEGQLSELASIHFEIKKVEGLINFPYISFGMETDIYRSTNFFGQILSDNTLSGEITGWLSQETPITFIRQTTY